ncbi:unnamed protein product [Ectocarpus sp. 8 AP-2014]
MRGSHAGTTHPPLPPPTSQSADPHTYPLPVHRKQPSGTVVYVPTYNTGKPTQAMTRACTSNDKKQREHKTKTCTTSLPLCPPSFFYFILFACVSKRSEHIGRAAHQHHSKPPAKKHKPTASVPVAASGPC